MQHRPLGKTGLRIPEVALGTTPLGNLFRAIGREEKLALVAEWFRHVPPPMLIDTAGKYGAGMALEMLAAGLSQANVLPEQTIISNKLAWLRVPLQGKQPSFEPDAWIDLQHDAEQQISYDGILACWRQGCRLLKPYRTHLVSVHDPDDYLAAATSPEERDRRWQDILGAYQALRELKAQGDVVGVGVGAKDWRVIARLDGAVELDWVMIANSLTILKHPPELLALVRSLAERQIGVVNAAVFHAGFLVGGAWYDYQPVDPLRDEHRRLLQWRSKFTAICRRFDIPPAQACLRFAASPPGVTAVAVSTSRVDRVAEQLAMLTSDVPATFWTALKDAGLIAREVEFV